VPAPAPALLLWDIDGTLLLRASDSHAAALAHALLEVHGVQLRRDGRRADRAGRTDGAIARELLTEAGVSPQAIDAGWDALRTAWCRAYAATVEPDLSHTVAPGIPALLERLAARDDVQLALLTGNLEPIARLKLERAGLARFFPPGQGAFGSDHEERAALPDIARARAGGVPRERTLIIGDTPRDIACARAGGVEVLAVTTGPFDAAELADADAVARDPAELEALLESWLAERAAAA
jgi:phosphoglycolate phosphatase-like HAD superfamily hydrolase